MGKLRSGLGGFFFDLQNLLFLQLLVLQKVVVMILTEIGTGWTDKMKLNLLCIQKVEDLMVRAVTVSGKGPYRT